jgi:hypothetical protein
MGYKVSGGPPMRRISWSSVDIVSRLLEADEREAVRGDLTEAGASGGRALCDVLGLVVRRQAALGMDWRPWLALRGIVAPVVCCSVMSPGDDQGDQMEEISEHQQRDYGMDDQGRLSDSPTQGQQERDEERHDGREAYAVVGCKIKGINRNGFSAGTHAIKRDVARSS